MLVRPLHDQDLPRASIQDRFEAFNRANPWVFTALHRLALDLVNRGQRKLGIGMLVEVVRWQYALSTADPSSPFKINNDYRSRFARLLIERDPRLDGRFELRELREKKSA